MCVNMQSVSYVCQHTIRYACVSAYSQSGMCVSTQSDMHVCTAYSWSLLGEELSIGGGSSSLFTLFLVPELESRVICIVVALLHSHLRIATESVHFCSELTVAAALGSCECDI